MTGRPKVELEIDPAKVIQMNGEPITFYSRLSDRGKLSPSTRLVVYVVEDVDGHEAELVFVGHAKRGDTVTITHEAGQ